MKSRRKLRLLLVSLFGLGFSVIVLQVARAAFRRGDWVAASKPVTTSRTNAESQQSVVAFSVSNSGPGTIDFSVVWCEGRSGTLNLFPATPRSRGGPHALASGAVTNVELEMISGLAVDPKPLVCCKIDWMQREPRLRRWLRQFDQAMDWLGALFDFSWHPSWRGKPLANGEVFTSNLSVADYFNRVHGFTRKQWLEEQRLKQQRQEELARLQTNLAPSQGLFWSINWSNLPPPAAERQAEQDAKLAFDRFCVISTNRVSGARTQPPAGETGPNREAPKQ